MGPTRTQSRIRPAHGRSHHLDGQRARAADTLRTVADELSEHAGGGRTEEAAEMARRVASRVDRRKGRTLAYQARRSSTQHPGVVAGVLGAVVLVATGALVVTALRRRREAAAREEEERAVQERWGVAEQRRSPTSAW